MRIIGVIDLKEGHAVHARAGHRETYPPVRRVAGFDAGGDPIELAGIYIDHLDLREIYVADLDAIEFAAPQSAIVRRIADRGVRLLVDAAVGTVEDARRTAAAGADVLVAGLETLASFDALSAVRAALPDHGLAFSLDLRAGAPMAARLNRPGLSPEDLAREAVAAGADTVIVLDVARVGLRGGPDLDTIAAVRAAAPGVSLLAGGGVRDLDDLRRLADVGCEGALVATALHDGRLTAADVAAAHAL